MANEPITVQLTATSALNGNGSINLTRATLNPSATGRFWSASIPSGSRLSSDIFGLFSGDSVKAVTLTTTTRCPTDVARVVVGASVRTEVQLAAASTVLLAPGEELAFVTKSSIVLTITVNELAETEQATWASRSSVPLSRVRLLKSDGSGYSPAGVANIALTWDDNARLFTASAIGGGSFELATLVPREFRFEGVTARVRVSGFDGETASVGYAEPITGDAFFVADVRNGEWSPRFTISHDDRVAISSPPRRPGVSTLVADVELVPAGALGECCEGSSSAPGTPSETPGIAPGGLVSFNEWENYSVNSAGASQTNAGWDLWTYANPANPAGGFNNATRTGNKGLLATGVLDEWPLDRLEAIELRYACRTSSVASTLNHPYVNIQIDVNGDGTLYKIGVIDYTNDATNLLTQTSVGATPEEHEYTLTWIGDGRIKVVNDIAGVIPVVNGPNWLSRIYRIEDIVAVYPNAKIVRAFSNDGGLPANQELPGFWLNLGDSNYVQNSRILVRGVRING